MQQERIPLKKNCKDNSPNHFIFKGEISMEIEFDRLVKRFQDYISFNTQSS